MLLVSLYYSAPARVVVDHEENCIHGHVLRDESSSDVLAQLAQHAQHAQHAPRDVHTVKIPVRQGVFVLSSPVGRPAPYTLSQSELKRHSDTKRHQAYLEAFDWELQQQCDGAGTGGLMKEYVILRSIWSVDVVVEHC